MQAKLTKHLAVVLKKMCAIVDADFDKIDFEKQYWYHKYSWTPAQADKFVEWMVKYLKKNKDARDEFMHFPRNSERVIREVAEEFVWQYGWKELDE